MSEVIMLIVGAVLGLAIFAGYLWRAHEDAKDPYADWVREIMVNTPGFEPPYIMGGNGRYISNPRWQPHQTIRHTDGKETKL